MSFHRAETVDNKNKLKSILDLTKKLQHIYNKKIIISTHPRTKSKIDIEKYSTDEIIFLKPFGFSDYINLQKNSFVTISDSGTVTEESSILGFKAVNLRETQERHEGFEQGTIILSGLNIDAIINSIEITLNSPNSSIVRDYDVDNISYKIVKIIQSYIQYINKYTWRKHL